MAKQKWKVGIAGLGFGQAVHLPALRLIPEVEVTALVGRDFAKASRIASEQGVPQVMRGLSELFALPLDFVTVALPPEQNAEAARLGLLHKKPLFVEKPLAAEAATAKTLADEASAKSLLTGIDFEFMELPAWQEAKKILSQKPLGEVEEISVRWEVQSYAIKNKLWSWKLDARAGGGVLFSHASHFFFLLEWLVGPLAHFTCQKSNQAASACAPMGQVAAEDTVAISGALASGVAIKSAISFAANQHLGHEWSFRCRDGQIILANYGTDYMNGFFLELRPKTASAIRVFSDSPAQGDGRVRAVHAMLKRFVLSLEQKQNFYPGFAEGARVQELLEQAGAGH